MLAVPIYYPLLGWICRNTLCQFGFVMEYFCFSIYVNWEFCWAGICVLWGSIWHPVLIRVSIPAQTSWPWSTWGGKGLFGLHFHSAVHPWRKSGLELKQVRKQELMQRPWRVVHYWLASPGLLSLFSMTTRPAMAPSRGGLSPLITNWENALQLDLMEAFPQLKLLSLW